MKIICKLQGSTALTSGRMTDVSTEHRKVSGPGQENAKDKNSFCLFLEYNTVSGIDHLVINSL
jgi:hypothetical protein